MGGKSTFIRSVAMSVLLTQIGSFVPADSARVSLVDGIFTRVGGSDQQLLGNSTFMAEMIETSKMLSSKDSLVIVDELGRGTCTADGFAIAYSVLKHLALVVKSFCLFATHFQELTESLKTTAMIKTLHAGVYCEGDKVIMTHEIKPGPCLRSFGILVAQNAMLPQEYIDVAKEKLKQLEEMFEGSKYDMMTVGDVDEMSDDQVWQRIERMKQLVKKNAVTEGV